MYRKERERFQSNAETGNNIKTNSKSLKSKAERELARRCSRKSTTPSESNSDHGNSPDAARKHPIGALSNSTIESLPTEMIFEIAEKLEDEDRSGLTALCLVSGRLCAIAQPLLYRNINVDLATDAPMLVYLVRTLFERPDLAEKVKSLRFHDGGRFSVIDDTLFWRLVRTNRVLDQIGAVRDQFVSIRAGGQNNHGLEIVSGALKRLWHKAMWGFRSPVIGLLMTLTPHLSDIDMCDWFTDRYPRFIRDLRPVWCPLHSLFGLPFVHSIEKGTYIGQVEALWPAMRGIQHVKTLKTRASHISMLNLPFENLRKLEVDLREHRAVKLIDGGLEANASLRKFDAVHVYRSYPSLKSLKILGNIVDVCGSTAPHLLSDLLGDGRLACKNLAELSFEILRYPHGEVDGFHGSFDYLTESLNAVAGSLRRLRIDAAERLDLSVFCTFWRLLSLKHLCPKRLEVLQCAILPQGFTHRQTWTKIDRFLPEVLEELCIISPNERILQWLEGIDRRKFWSLKLVELHCRRDWGRPASWFQRRHAILLALRMSGIEVRVTQDGTRPEAGIWIGLWSEEDWRTPLFGKGF